jgi:S-formylglutathione hydrolase FrmB
MPVVIEEFESQVLKGNPLNDPPTRKIPVYLPPSYRRDPSRQYPVVFMLHGFTGNSMMWLNVNSFYQPTVPERFERMIAEKRSGEMILVFVDGYCGLGGSQYVNSSATGRYEDYVIKELVPFIDGKFPTTAKVEERAVAGKSSGGFGAVYLALRHPDVFSAFASHAGDMYFEYCYKPDFIKAVNGLAPYSQTADPVGAFLAAFAQAEQKGKFMDTLNVLAMAACYSPGADNKVGFELPFDLKTGEVRPEIWEAWLKFDPVKMLEKPEYLDALKQLKGRYLDAGSRDEFSLHLGARIFASKAANLGVKVHHEEFEDGHMNINYRYERSLAYLWRIIGEKTPGDS